MASTTRGSPLGSILIFLPDRTLLMDSCFETFRVSKWGVAGNRIRWVEDTIPIEAEVITPSPNELTLRIAGPGPRTDLHGDDRAVHLPGHAEVS